MLRPVKFDTARDPGTKQPDKRRLDHVIIVYKIITVRLVIGPLNPSSELREDHHLYIIILKKDRVICLIRFHTADLFRRGVRIHFSTAALIDSFLQKHRILIRLAGFISRDHYLFFPYSCFTHLLLPFPESPVPSGSVFIHIISG